MICIVKPCGFSASRQMVDAARDIRQLRRCGAPYGLCRDVGNQLGPSGSAPLVVDHGEAVTLFGQPDHGDHDEQAKTDDLRSGPSPVSR